MGPALTQRSKPPLTTHTKTQIQEMQVITFANAVFTTVGVVLLVGAGIVSQKTRSFLADAAKAEGTVIELKASRSKDSTTYRPVVRFIDPNGQTVEFTSSTGSNPPLYQAGQKVEVLYRPTEPRNAKINGFFSLWGVSAIMAGMGGVFFLIGFSSLVAGARKRRQNEFLRTQGLPIETEFLGVEQNAAVTLNGRHPYQVLTQWLNPATSELHVFKSDNLWVDPSSHLQGRKITVLIDQNPPQHYWVDLSFLPKLAK